MPDSRTVLLEGAARLHVWARVAIAVGIFVISLPCAAAQAPEIVKTWTFTLPHGTMRVILQAYPDGHTSMGISASQEGPEAPIREQVEPLKQVLAEMSSLGFEPRRLAYMGRLFYGSPEDAANKLAYACADSKECRFTIDSPGKDKVKVLVALLNQCGAFEPYNEAFKDYGIRVQVTAAEKLVLVRFSTVPPRNSRDRANGRMLVLGGASIGMRFSPIDATPADKSKQ